MRNALLFFLGFVSFILGSCSAPNTVQQIQKPEDGSGEYWYVLEAGNVPFEAENIMVNTSLMATHVWVKIVNKTNGVMKIIWDECAYIDFEGKTHMVYHTGIILHTGIDYTFCHSERNEESRRHRFFAALRMTFMPVRSINTLSEKNRRCLA